LRDRRPAPKKTPEEEIHEQGDRRRRVGGRDQAPRLRPGAPFIFYDASTYDCGFHSFQQCLATVRGADGWCRQNFFEPSGGARRPTGRKKPEARY
jgi:hypothetical protein